MDRNSTIGLVLISALLFVYFAFFAPDANQLAQETNKASIADTTSQNKSQVSPETAVLDSARKQQLGSLATFASGSEKSVTLENKDLRIVLSSKGGKIVSVVAKNYKTYSGGTVQLWDQEATSFQLQLPLGNQTTANLYDLYFDDVQSTTLGDTTVLTFKTAGSTSTSGISQTYKLAKEGYVVGYSLSANGLGELAANKEAQLVWTQKLRNFEKDAEQNRLASTVNYYTVSGQFDKLNETSKESQTEKLEEKAKWVALKQKFFNTAIVSEQGFGSVEVASSVDASDNVYIKNLSTKMSIATASLTGQGSTFNFYFGPNHYQLCKAVTDGFEENVYLGWPVLNNLNRFVTVPIFHFLENFFSNYGLIILLLVVIIKAALFPLSYKSYLSMAKIRVLKPEMDEIKAKYGDDMQRSQTENMKLYQSVGVNPLAGCIPVLLTMPVLLAIFNFFPNSIELRQQAFLWADDLSTYDVIAKLPFTIPFYGDHVSLFTILMTISTLVYTWYNNQMSAANMQGPMIAMSYIMPVVFMFVLNSLPAGLSYYYFVSNVITIGQQLLIKSFVDENQIRAQLDANKVKLATQPQKQNRFMKRLEEAMKAQEELKKGKK